MSEAKYIKPEQSEINRVPTVIVDPHHEVFFYWALDYQRRARNGSAEPAQLIHIDRHADNDVTHHKLPKDLVAVSKRNLWRYTQNLWVGTFIIPATEYGILRPSRIWFDPSQSPRDVRVYPISSGEEDRRSCDQILADAKRYDGITWWDIDVDAFDCIEKGQRLGEYGTIDSRMQETEEFLREMPRPSFISVALSQTPTTYVDPAKVEMLKGKTIEMLTRLTE
jgi:hypothetical protein